LEIKMSPANRRIRALEMAIAIALSGTAGCAGVISSLADPSLEKQFPRASVEGPAARYETPIPHQYQAYTPTSLREQQRQFDRTATLIEVVDGIRWTFARLAPFSPDNVTVTSSADKLCDSGSAMVTGTEWMGAAALQPMSLKDAVVRSRCRTAFRDHFLR
jgi:hypothetical protein